MDFQYMHPRDQIVMIMERIYGYGMTTTSGGNLSILDEAGDLWITPAAVDKGKLRAADIVRVGADGAIDGIHKPSSEYPFHRAILERRPDLKAILHAHPPALVSFSIAGRIPDTRMIPKARFICGEVGFAPYAVPGSDDLGASIAGTFAGGCSTVLLENHGIVTGGESLFQAFQRFETLDFCARLIIRAETLGGARPLTQAQLDLWSEEHDRLPEFTPAVRTSPERALRKSMAEMIHRSYDQMLVTSLEGTFSARLDERSFLITPWGVDRKYMEPGDMVLLRDGACEAQKTPSRSVRLHARLYEEHPDLGAVIIAHPHNAMAFGVSAAQLDTRTIPESYIVLKDIPVLPYGTQFLDVGRLSGVLGAGKPVMMVENDCLIATGKDLLQAYDRLEVAEFSAKAVLAARALGPLRPIDDERVAELEAAFGV